MRRRKKNTASLILFGSVCERSEPMNRQQKIRRATYRAKRDKEKQMIIEQDKGYNIKDY